MKRYRASNVEQLDSIAPEILAEIADTRVVCFDAPMGAGKTTLIKALCKALGTADIVNSPTFAIVNDYALPDGESVYHFDLYRLKELAEAYDMGCEDYFYSGCYCFVEWPGIAETLLPDNTKTITIDVAPDDTREIIIS
jgi:tRNA threonylcarbamoyladenosine biosynthesis protein TsaE